MRRGSMLVGSETPVPAADSTDNVNTSDVVGNKTDTVAGNSLVALAKQTIASLATITANWLVPAKDSLDNVDIADVIGNKLDASYNGGNSLYARMHTMSEHFHARQMVYPTSADPITVTAASGAGTWTNGSWVEIIPANTIEEPFDIHHVDVSAMSANEDFELDLGNGTTVIATCSFTRGGVQSQSIDRPFMMGIQAANSQIQARIRTGDDGGETCNIKVWYHTY